MSIFEHESNPYALSDFTFGGNCVYLVFVRVALRWRCHYTRRFALRFAGVCVFTTCKRKPMRIDWGLWFPDSGGTGKKRSQNNRKAGAPFGDHGQAFCYHYHLICAFLQ